MHGESWPRRCSTARAPRPAPTRTMRRSRAPWRGGGRVASQIALRPRGVVFLGLARVQPQPLHRGDRQPRQETLRRFSGPFAEEARWYIGPSRYPLADYPAAFAGVRVPEQRSGPAASRKLLGGRDVAEARPQARKAIERWQRIVDSQPLGYYGMMARVRLRDEGVR